MGCLSQSANIIGWAVRNILSTPTTDAETGVITPLYGNFDPATDPWNIKWDGETLTLNGATIIYDVYYIDAAISCTGDLKIELMGDNTVTGRSCGIDSNGDITISGSGTLAVIGGDVSENGYASYGIYAGGGNVTVEGANVTATGGNIDDDSYGIYAGGDVTVEGATVTASGGDVSENGYDSYGIYADGDVNS